MILHRTTCCSASPQQIEVVEFGVSRRRASVNDNGSCTLRVCLHV